MNMREIERKWQQKWESEKLNCFDRKNIDKKYYCLEMFSYPSAAKLHVGHWYNYGPTDSFARYKKMKGYEIFQPMGFDAFGLPGGKLRDKNSSTPKTALLKTSKRWKTPCAKWARCSTGRARLKPACPTTTNGRSGCFCSFINTACIQKGSTRQLVSELPDGSSERTGYSGRVRKVPLRRYSERFNAVVL